MKPKYEIQVTLESGAENVYFSNWFVVMGQFLAFVDITTDEPKKFIKEHCVVKNLR